MLFKLLWQVVYLANKSLVAYSLLGEFCRIKSDFLLAGIDDMSDLQIQHVVQLKCKNIYSVVNICAFLLHILFVCLMIFCYI